MNTTAKALCIAVPMAFVPSVVAHAQTGPAVLVLRGHAGPHVFSVRLAQGPFRKSAHRVTYGQDGYRVDGRGAIGTAGYYLPTTELTAFTVAVDGRRWPVPARLWRDCFNPSLGQAPSAHLSRDGRRLRVVMRGGDAAGSYDVAWRLRPDGHDTRALGGGEL